MLNETLATLGFNEHEIKAYLLLLEIGPITAGNLAKKFGVPRSSLYGFLKRLQDKGIIGQSIKGGVKVFLAEAPEKANFLFSQKIEELERQQKIYQELLPQLRQKQATKFIAPKLQLFEGELGLKNVLKDMLLYRDLETQAFWPAKKMVEALSPDFFRYHNKERIKNNLSIRAIWPESQMVDIKERPYLGAGEEFLREIKIAPPAIDFSLGYWIYGNKVAFLSSR